MDGPSQRSRALDPTTPVEPEPAAPDPEEPHGPAGEDEAAHAEPGANEARRDEAATDDARPDGARPDDARLSPATEDDATPGRAEVNGAASDGAAPEGATDGPAPDGAAPDGATSDEPAPDGAAPGGAVAEPSGASDGVGSDDLLPAPASDEGAEPSTAAHVGARADAKTGVDESTSGDVTASDGLDVHAEGDDRPKATKATEAAEAAEATAAAEATEVREPGPAGQAAEAGNPEPIEPAETEAPEPQGPRAEPAGPGEQGGPAGPAVPVEPDELAESVHAAEPGRSGTSVESRTQAGAPDAGPVVAAERRDAHEDDEAVAAPLDVQVIALALVEAATEDAARVSPAPTEPPRESEPPRDPAPPHDPEPPRDPEPPGDLAPGRDPAPPRDPAPLRDFAPAHDPASVTTVPPFPAPVAPARPARDPHGSARHVVQRARDLRMWWTGVGTDGDPAERAAAVTRNRRIGIGAGAAVVVLIAVYAIAAVVQADVVPVGTTVAGAELGGQSTAEAADILAEALTETAAKPVELVAGKASTTLDPVAAGLAVDVAATADSLTGFSLSPARMWRHLFGAGPATPVLDVDDKAFASVVAGLEESMAVAPVDGAVEFTGVTPTATSAQDGTRIDPDAAARAIRSAWLVEDGPVELPTRTVPPEITQEETDAALAEAKKIVSGPVEVSAGGQRAQLPPKVLASAASFVVKDGELAARFDGATLTRAIVERTDNLLTMADGAQFSFASGRPEVVGGELGTTLADGPTRSAIRAAALGAERTATLEVVRQTPENSTQALRAMGVEEVVAEFSTPLTNDYVRTQNLIRGAEMITGDLIRPGETFSLISALSPITLANGYVASGMIIGGQHIDGVGGGLSQMATTSYNAAMIAGFEDVEHHPHSYWFERYPAGREATIAVGSKDMKVRNNTPYGAVLQSWVADNQLHVRIWSTKHLKNTWTDGEKRNVVAPGVVTSTDPGCVPYPGGEPGFTITVGRKVERIGDGKVVIERSYTTTYRPDHALACVTPEPPPLPEDPDDPEGGTAPTPPGPDA
ncbi:VanW family protein [Myceligenerans salitolerans]|uniref:VanW family protein n=1 Tax=Myceligenerans salitolerans TaxID=1230528 RepID=A0ABS3IC76_9MICO|nr:VanW family protein [Myceligenerans salitolerans]MBO0610627.1 VanW family protein [Myceligenerans salitolerans]